MRLLLYSFYCPNDCDRKETQQDIEFSPRKILHAKGSIISDFPAERIAMKMDPSQRQNFINSSRGMSFWSAWSINGKWKAGRPKMGDIHQAEIVLAIDEINGRIVVQKNRNGANDFDSIPNWNP